MQLHHDHWPRILAGAPTMLGTASAIMIVLHASQLGPFVSDALRLAVIAMSASAAAEYALGDRTTGLVLSVLTIVLYWLFLYPLELIPPRPLFFRAFYVAIGAGSLAVAPVLLLRRHFGLAAAGLFSGAVTLAYTLP